MCIKKYKYKKFLTQNLLQKFEKVAWNFDKIDPVTPIFVKMSSVQLSYIL